MRGSTAKRLRKDGTLKSLNRNKTKPTRRYYKQVENKVGTNTYTSIVPHFKGTKPRFVSPMAIIADAVVGMLVGKRNGS